MKLVDQWRTIEDALPPDWTTARLDVVVETGGDRAGAAGLLGPANPGRVGDALRLHVRRGGGPGAVGPDGVRRLFGRLDEARIWSELRLVDVEEAAPEEVPAEVSLVDRWNAVTATLPPDWSDLHLELRLRASDQAPRVALLCAPLNPTRAGTLALRFRVASRTGYGAAPAMAARCLARMDEEGIRGGLELLRVLSETRHVATQGPVWRVGGRSV